MPTARLRPIAVIAAIAVCLLFATVLSGRQTIITTDGGILARDATPAPKGTGVVLGRTIDAVSGKPIGDVVVTLTLTLPPFSGYQAVVSDDQGRFVVRELPKGAFRVYAVKPGYIPGGYRKRLLSDDDNRFGQSLDLNEAERALDVTITLWKYAAIEGMVTDETGDPIVGTSVRALPRRVVAGQSRFAMETGAIPFGSYSARTDDRGMYRLDSLPPGDYVVAVPVIVWSAPKTRPAPTEATSTSSNGLYSWTGGSRSGGTGTGTIEVGDERFGIYSLPGIGSTATPPTLAGFTPQGRPLVYETQYFSGSTSLGRAAVVTVGSGDTRSAVDFRLRPAPASKISGLVSGPNGPAPQLTLRLVSAEMNSTTSDPEIGITTSDSEGRFVFLGVTPGQYAIRALDVPRARTSPTSSTSSTVQAAGGGSRIIFSSGSPAIPDEPTWWADTAVSIGERDVTDVAVTLRPSARIRGRVEFEGSAPRPTTRTPSVSIVRADGQRQAYSSVNYGRLDEQWRLVTYGQVPGQYLVNLTGPPPGGYFVGAFVGARDVSVLPLEIGASDIDDVVIKLTDKPLGTISGAVVNSQGQPDTQATALVFPADRAQWVNTGPSPRMIRAAGTGRAGRYTVEGLPAGEYLVAAVANVPMGWADPKSLEALSRGATRVTLRDRENATANLRVTPTGAPALALDVQPVTTSRGSLNEIAHASGHGPFVDDGHEDQTRDTTTPAVPVGTSRVAGTIWLDDERRRPAPRVIVTLTGAAGAGTRTIITNETGRFDFSGLPAGRFLLSASKPAYLSVAYGATRVGGSGTQIGLTDGQQVTNLALTIRKGSVITGIVRDERGQTMQGATVQVLQYRAAANGDRRLVIGSSGSTGQTDQRGVYRMYGLSPGDYYVSASANYVTGTARPTTAADVQFAQQPAATSSSRPGAASYSGAPGSAAAASDSRAVIRRYVPVLYPGVFTTEGAQIVKVGVAEERAGIDMALRMVPAVTVEGTIVGGGGALPSNLEVRLLSVGDVVPTSGIGDIASLLPIRVGPNGRFSFPAVAPGQYVVAANTPTAGARGGRGAADAGPSEGLWGTATIDVNGVDISSAIVTLQPSMSVSGRIRFEGSTLQPPADLSTARVSLTPVLTGTQVAMGQTSANATADGSFTFAGLTPGRYTLRATVSSATGWIIKGVSAAAQDATDAPFELKGGENVTDATIVFGDRPGEVSGTLQDASGRAATEYIVLLLPADPAKWRSLSRRVLQIRPTGEGKFTFRNLLPGDYVLAAATEIEPGATTDPEFLTELARSGTKVTLAEGEKKVQDIKIR